jgi:hypothetical protein
MKQSFTVRQGALDGVEAAFAVMARERIDLADRRDVENLDLQPEGGSGFPRSEDGRT